MEEHEVVEQTEDKIDQLEHLLKSRAQNNRISCQAAFEIAAQFGVSPSEVGNVLNELKIKISRCQLGCF